MKIILKTLWKCSKWTLGSPYTKYSILETSFPQRFIWDRNTNTVVIHSLQNYKKGVTCDVHSSLAPSHSQRALFGKRKKKRQEEKKKSVALSQRETIEIYSKKPRHLHDSVACNTFTAAKSGTRLGVQQQRMNGERKHGFYTLWKIARL